MANHSTILFPLILILLFAAALVPNNSAAYTSLCTQTPYPDLCSSLSTNSPNAHDFHDVSIRATLTQAQNVYSLLFSNTNLLSPTILSNELLARTAWADSLYLYQDTISKLNRTLITHPKNTDAQTLLSGAIANEQACRNGFHDFNLHQSFPDMLAVLSKLLRNSLAIVSKATYSASPARTGNRRLLASSRDHDGFPAWLSPTDRKLLQSSGAPTQPDVVVAQDGSGDYETISAAVAAVSGGGGRFVVYVKKGVYEENVEVTTPNIAVVGDGIDMTVVTGSNNVQDGSTTFRSATFVATGDGFIARGITFENTAGPEKRQAVALRCGSDLSVFYECSFKGYQDTLYAYSQHQFYRSCDIYGTVDFIFGDAASVFQDCNIYVRQPMPDQQTTVTAQGRKDPNENTGIIIQNSRVTSASPGPSSTQNYLGRPWGMYSRTVFMECAIDGLINPAGWAPWNGDFGLATLYYGEYMNTGSGANTSGRVRWPGFHVITSAAVAQEFTVESFLGGDSWIPATGIPYTSGL